MYPADTKQTNSPRANVGVGWQRAGLHLIAYTGTVRGRIYFTTRGYDHWFGGLPTGEQAELCNAADEWVELVKAMFADGAA